MVYLSHDSSRWIREMKDGRRRRKPGVMKIAGAAPWSSVKQRACSNIWWVSSLTPRKQENAKQVSCQRVIGYQIMSVTRNSLLTCKLCVFSCPMTRATQMRWICCKYKYLCVRVYYKSMSLKYCIVSCDRITTLMQTYHAGTIPSRRAEIQCHVLRQKLSWNKYIFRTSKKVIYSLLTTG